MKEIQKLKTPTDRPTDWTPAFNRAAQNLVSGEILLGPKETHCDCFPEMAIEPTIWAVNNGGGPTRCAMLLEDKENIVVDGQGMHLQLRGAPQAGRGETGTLEAPMIPIVARRCKNLTIKNLSIDWEKPFVLQGEIISSEPRQLRVRMQKTNQRWWAWNGQLYVEGEGWTLPVRRLLAVEPETGEMVRGLADNFNLGYDVNWRYSSENKDIVVIEAPIDAPLPPVGKMVLFWVSGFGTMGRLCSSILLDECENVTIENVTLHHAWGMGIIGQRCENITLDHCQVKPSGDRLFSLTADATHFVSCKGTLELSNNQFQNQFDDAINVHGAYLQLVQQISPTELILRRGHVQHHHTPLLVAGDEGTWIDPDTLHPLGTCDIQTVTPLNGECMRVTLTAPIQLPDGAIFENTDRTPVVHIHDNLFRWNRARGILMNTPRDVRIENNTLQCPGNAIVWEAFNSYLESGGIGRVTVSGNHFIDCAHTEPWGTALLAIQSAETPNGPVVMGTEKSLRFENNTIETLHGNLIAGGPIRELIVTNNQLPPGVTEETVITCTLQPE